MSVTESVALLLVSHSRALAEATETLVRQVTRDSVQIALAAGAGEEGAELGTDATRIVAALETLAAQPVLILMDLGSALLSAQMAMDFLPSERRAQVALCPAPFVEGALAATLAAQAGARLSEVAQEANNALRGKRAEFSDQEAVPEATRELHADARMAKRCYSLQDPAGLHLRPAAELVRLAGEASEDVWIGRSGAEALLAPAKSLSALLGLELRQGEDLCVYSRDALNATLVAQLDALLGSPAAELQKTSPHGIVPGFAVALLTEVQGNLLDLLPTTETPVADAAERIRLAMAAVGEKAQGEGILDAQRALLADPRLLQMVDAELARGKGPAHAWATAVEALAQEIERLRQPLLRARATDWRDLGRQVLQQLLGVTDESAQTVGPRILLVDELSPSLAAKLDPSLVLGVIDRRGAKNSHAAILLRGAGIPYIIDAHYPALRAGVRVAMDGASGEIIVAPSEEQLRAMRAPYGEVKQLEQPAGFAGIIATVDGAQVELWANVASPAEAREAQRLCACGIGLLRTEFLYLDQWQVPSEEEQIQRLLEILTPLTGRRSIIRLLDAGADKPLPFLRLPEEANPALGLRGIRALLARPDFLQSQLRAILRAGYGLDIAVMLPMVTNPEEVDELRTLLATVHTALYAQGIDHAWPVPVGIMAEVPAMLLEGASFRGVADFVSVGTNDLTQYVLAADRGDDRLHDLGGAGHPAILSLIQQLLRDIDVPVSVCGEAAGDPRLARSLVAAGIRRLSMSPRSFAGVIQELRNDEPE
ncbi:dihydroxyacetone kinase phosphoryl donor subunit DhaM [Acidithiobacillus sp. IBUN Pt1247-S3]|uniref:dihydroxyacetone kinase phosphoryl donor subunit DhaM n=1 Tax=Acidithiobacillus sp. IBUN Pt1247-S3 TaxID=3166642 RepID=UPI0034E37C7E